MSKPAADERRLVLRGPLALRRMAWLLGLTAALFTSIANVSAAPPRKQQSAGNVLAWGDNTYGGLGNGTTTESLTPVPVPNFPGVVAIAAASSHTLALKSDGTVWGWGDNDSGQLGNGTTTDSHTPVQVILGPGLPPLSGVVAIAAGSSHSLALKSDGTVWAWGYNAFGELGNGTTTSSTIPVPVNTLTGLTGVIAIAAGGAHSLALKSDGTVWAWGYNNYGQLGNGTTNKSDSPGQVLDVSGGALSGVVSVASGGYHSLALKSDGTVWAWGYNAFGQLGNDTTTNSTTPVHVSGLTGVTGIAGGTTHSLAIEGDGSAWAWGRNTIGQLGNGTTTDSPTPVQVSKAPGFPLSGVVAIAGGASHSLALESDGTVWAWGANSSGQFGNGTTINSSTPVQAINLTGPAAIAAGSSHSVAIQSQASGAAWGLNVFGELGNGTTTDSDVPVPTSNISGLTAVAGGGAHSLALLSDGTVHAWGNNSNGQLGDGNNNQSALPVVVSNLAGAVAIAAGEYHSMALVSDGTVRAWGWNVVGQLGDGSTADSNSPVTVVNLDGSNLSGVVAIAAGGSHSLALKSDGTVWAWGNNGAGQLGDGTTLERNNPVQVVLHFDGSPLSGVVAVAGGYYFSMALKNDGTVWTWGDNSHGQLGNNTTVGYSTTPVQVLTTSGAPLSGVQAISTQGGHGLALKTDGTVWAWGSNGDGELGNGTTKSSATAVQVITASGTAFSGASAIVGAFFASLALRDDGTVWAWGYNGEGELGNGATNDSSTPVRVCDLNGASAIGAGWHHSLAAALVSGPRPPCISSPNSAFFEVGQPVSFTVTTTDSPTPTLTEIGSLPNGVMFLDNGNGTGTLSGAAAPGTVATYNITFTAQNGVAPNATQSFRLIIAQAATTTSLTAAPNPANSGQSVTLTASVTVLAPGSGTPTGTVTFFDGLTPLVCTGGNQTLSAGQATCQYTFATVGSHSLTAVYSGDASFTSSNGGTSLTVTAPAPPPPVPIMVNETIHVTDVESFPDAFDAEAVHVTDTVFITPLIQVSAPVAEFSASALGFSGQSGNQTVIVSDIGLATLTLGSETISGTSQFAITQVACSNGAASLSSLSTVLPSGGVCTLTIHYTASAAPANDNAVLTFNDNAALSNLTTAGAAPNYTQAIPLSGGNQTIGPPPPPPAMVAVMFNEMIHVTDTESFPDVFDAETIHVTDRVTVTAFTPVVKIVPAPSSPVTITASSSGSYLVTLLVVNQGNVSVDVLTLSSAKLGAPTLSGSPLAAIRNLAPGATGTFNLVFPASAGAAGTKVAFSVTGTYSASEGNLSGNWSFGTRAIFTLP